MVHPFEIAQLLSLFFIKDSYLWKHLNVIQGPEYYIIILSKKWNMNMSLYNGFGLSLSEGF